jgi:hypothetical protein
LNIHLHVAGSLVLQATACNWHNSCVSTINPWRHTS